MGESRHIPKGQVPARPPTLTCGWGSPVRLVQGQPLHLKPAGTAVVLEVPGAEACHTLHTTYELEQLREVGEDSLQPGEAGAQTV